MSGVACHHRLWAAKTVERRPTWHAIIAVGLAHTVGRCQAWHAIIALGWKTQSNNVGCGMPSSPLDSTHGRTTLGVACHHRLWAAHTIERHRAWHDITSHGQHTRSNDVGRGMPSSPLDSTHGRTTSGVACHHRHWEAHTVERRSTWHAIIAVGLAHTVGRRRAWHAIIAIGRRTRSNDVGRGMPSSPLD